jgi:hypothetical protein
MNMSSGDQDDEPNSACFVCGYALDCEVAYHSPPYDVCFCVDECYVEVTSALDQPRVCQFCDDPTPAVALAAQSTDLGVTRTWAMTCAAHLEGWNDEHEWEAPILMLQPSTAEFVS